MAKTQTVFDPLITVYHFFKTVLYNYSLINNHFNKPILLLQIILNLIMSVYIWMGLTSTVNCNKRNKKTLQKQKWKYGFYAL